MQSDLQPEFLAARLNTRWMGRSHLHLTGCTSTNDVAGGEGRKGAAAGLLVTADEQTGGRGRQGRSWHSPAGDNIYASLLLRPRRPPPEIPPLTLLVGGALAEALMTLGPGCGTPGADTAKWQAWVKWPNDLLLADPGGGRKKVAGILTEAVTEGERIAHVVVGIGINVNTDRFPDELVSKATSLRLAASATGNPPLSRAEILAQILNRLEPAYEQFESEGAPAAIRLWERYADIGRACRARLEGRDVEGVIAGVATDGALLVLDGNNRRHRIVAGEVTMVGEPPA